MTTDKITLDIIWGKLQATNILDKENKYSQDDIKKLDIISGFMILFFRTSAAEGTARAARLTPYPRRTSPVSR